MIGLIGLYAGVFFILVMIQFTKQGRFEQQVGNMLVSGRLAAEESAEQSVAAGVYAGNNAAEKFLAAGAVVSFGGLDFPMTGNRNESIILIDGLGGKSEVVPESMTVSPQAVDFRLPGGTRLQFFTQSGGVPELRISGEFAADAAGISLPYKLQRASRIRMDGEEQFIVTANGLNYVLSRSILEEEPGRLFLKAGDMAISYRAVPEKGAFIPADFSINAARNTQTYNEAIKGWQDQNFALWNRLVPARNDEDLIIAYESEAIRRNNYQAALAAVPSAFRNGNQRTYESSVFLGGMESAVRSFAAAEREKISRLSQQITEKSPDFLKESHAFEFFAARGDSNFINNGIALVNSINPADLTLELIPGVFEGMIDLRQYRPNGDNPFERLADRACSIISERILRIPGSQGPGVSGDEAEDLILVFEGGRADIEFNLRLGKALLVWAEASNSEGWIALGRSLILSCLSLMDDDGAVPQALLINDAGELSGADDARTSSARLYRILCFGEYYPRAAVVVSAENGLWVWTAAQAVSAAQEGNVLDIAVTFPVGETHYMMIRGVQPFSRIELYGANWRSDTQFEQYDSSGWIYQAQDQILALKMRHRAAVEHVRIVYGTGTNSEATANPETTEPVNPGES
ncbi:hypothetical protein FACS189476_03470 [Spirochaetia bacterium]|nr:hypothetical protein FACS189476_03470 [Spirochaetia bacterium]